MGDRCYLRLTIHGHIENEFALREIMAALEHEHLRPDYTGQDGEEQYLDEFARALVNQDNPMFSDSEINYANIDGAQDKLMEHGVEWAVDHDAGSDYSAGLRSFDGVGLYEAYASDSEPMLLAGSVAELLGQPDALKQIAQLVADAAKAKGHGLPTFSCGDEVKALLAVRIAKMALDLKEKAA